MDSKKYFVGLDIGTNSVGWAVTDDKYKLQKFNGHKMWGARLFEEAKTAESRRLQRASRRRLQRRNNRIKLLQDLFAEEITKVDPGFYQRLEDSKFYIEDKRIKEKHVLFVDNKYNDVDFYNEFPTIYHLRYALLKGKKEYDVRLLYLAVHHILKNRGHFLYEGDNFNISSSLDEIMLEVLKNNDVLIDRNIINQSLINNIKNVILDSNKTRLDKKRELKDLFNNSKQLVAIFGLSIGTKESLSNLFEEEEYKDLDEDVEKISFREKVYDEVRDSYEEVLGDKIILIDSLKIIYDTILLMDIIKDGESLSESKVKLYEKHEKELKILKTILKEYSREEYNKMFSSAEKDLSNYTSYIGQGTKKSNREDFYKYLKSVIEKIQKEKDNFYTEELNYIISTMDKEEYLPLQRVKENGVIPYQIHRDELKIILENASKYMDFLNKTDNGLSIKEKILKIMTFRIPYYVGPINTYHSDKTNGFAWAEKNSGKENEKIYPWNFKEVINLEESHNKFIMRMTNKCTYLKGEDVLPKNSLLYTEYMMLNELNNIKCNGQQISIETKNLIIKDLFKDLDFSGKKTKKKIIEILRREGLCTGDAIITGIEDEIKADLKSYRDFKRILGDNFNYEMVEDIIKWITIYAEEKKSIEKRILENYSNELNKDQIAQILKLKYKDWGRLSKKLLTEIVCSKAIDYSTGEIGNIINAMRNTMFNFMELMSNSFSFKSQIDKINEENYAITEDLSYEMLDDLYVSPAVKRMIWQSILIIEEIKKIMGCEPEKIFIETVRSNKAEKKRKDTRKKRLLELYSNCKEDVKELTTGLNEKSDGDLRSKKLYLYYLQMGKCMYSGEIIDLNKLMYGDSYDIDHIYPRSKVKDDSFDNLVLVKYKYNRDKTDDYPLKKEIQSKMSDTWRFLFQKGFISAKKYERLVRTTELTPDELASFINRQIVETSQSTKAVAEIMTNLYKQSNIVYVKAENVSDFRRDFDFIKVRDINDLHHAKDAYLNIIVGNVYDTKFTKSPMNYIKDAKYRAYNLNRMFDFSVERNGYIAWDGRNNLNFKTVEKEMRSNDVRITRRLAEQKGQLFDITLIGKDKAKPESYLSIKQSDKRLADVTKYGGYAKVSTAYLQPFTCEVVSQSGEKRKIKNMVGIPVYLLKNLKENTIEEFILKKIKLKQDEKVEALKIIDAKLRIGELIKYNNCYYYVGGKTNERFCIDIAIQVYLGNQEEKYFKEIFKYLNQKKIDKKIVLEKYSEKINKDSNYKLYDVLIRKLGANIYLNSVGNKFKELDNIKIRNKFNALELEEQIKVLVNILNLLNNKVTTYDFKELGIKASRGTLGMDYSSTLEFKIVNQSITGLYQNEKNLLV